jgi:hypothetical protein
VQSQGPSGISMMRMRRSAPSVSKLPIFRRARSRNLVFSKRRDCACSARGQRMAMNAGWSVPQTPSDCRAGSTGTPPVRRTGSRTTTAH